MLNQKYIKDCDEIVGVTNEELIKNVNYQKFDCQVLVTKVKQTSGEWYNTYLIRPEFQKYPTNNLHCQQEVKYGVLSDIDLEMMVLCQYMGWKHNKDFEMTFTEMPE